MMTSDLVDRLLGIVIRDGWGANICRLFIFYCSESPLSQIRHHFTLLISPFLLKSMSTTSLSNSNSGTSSSPETSPSPEATVESEVLRLCDALFTWTCMNCTSPNSVTPPTASMREFAAFARTRMIAQRTLNTARYAFASVSGLWRSAVDSSRRARLAFEAGELGVGPPSREMLAAESAPQPQPPPELAELVAALPFMPLPPRVSPRLLAAQSCSECNCPLLRASASAREGVTNPLLFAPNLDLLVATMGEAALAQHHLTGSAVDPELAAAEAAADIDGDAGDAVMIDDDTTTAAAAAADLISFDEFLATVSARKAVALELSNRKVDHESVAALFKSPTEDSAWEILAKAARDGCDGRGFAPVTAIVYDERMLVHEEITRSGSNRGLAAALPGVQLPPAPPGLHPERPDRLRAIATHLVAAGLFSRCVRVPAREVTRAELCGVHKAEFLDTVDDLPQAVKAGGGRHVFDGGDTFANAGTLLAARLAAGSVCTITEAVLRGVADRGLALVRPPGHHAEPDASMGFCIFNNVAVAAKAALQCWGAKRVMIVDWDVHHGNGEKIVLK